MPPQLPWSPRPAAAAALAVTPWGLAPQTASECLLQCICQPSEARASSAGTQGTTLTCTAPASLLKLPSMHSLHRGCSYTRPLLQEQERELFCLIHSTNTKLSKMKRREYFSKEETKEPDKNPNQTVVSTLHDKEFHHKDAH